LAALEVAALGWLCLLACFQPAAALVGCSRWRAFCWLLLSVLGLDAALSPLHPPPPLFCRMWVTSAAAQRLNSSTTSARWVLAVGAGLVVAAGLFSCEL
jgi:hypothetical protein